ncbi:alpha/beta hydrolase [Kitasatospora sp. NPDC006697]|uniref:alpha/beta hydrolase n=1 Tax=Kitasatospora sp. NPDC006697 TaxID=3364020 RepID=UPI00369B1093
MKALLPAWRLHAKAAVVAVATAVAVLLPNAPAHADGAAPPTLADGFGLTQVATEPVIAAKNTPGDFVITVVTPQVTGRHHVRIVLPDGYYTSPGKRYPVLYLLHGSPGDPADYFDFSSAVNGSAGMIMVIPDGGSRGWYSNWANQNTVLGAQNWENFHINQVIPFIDANLRTIAAREGRSIAGISMGGFGAVHYAERHPGLFSQVASLSGDLDLSTNEMVLREVVVASLIDANGAICASTTGGCAGDPYAPGVDSDALYGSPYPVFNADRLWNENDPSAHADALRGMGVSIYVGNGGGPAGDVREWWLESASVHMKQHLDAAGIPLNWQDYGNGVSWGCDGGHDAGCWEQDLKDLIPRLQQAFASS